MTEEELTKYGKSVMYEMKAEAADEIAEKFDKTAVFTGANVRAYLAIYANTYRKAALKLR